MCFSHVSVCICYVWIMGMCNECFLRKIKNRKRCMQANVQEVCLESTESHSCCQPKSIPKEKISTSSRKATITETTVHTSTEKPTVKIEKNGRKGNEEIKSPASQDSSKEVSEPVVKFENKGENELF